MKLGRFDRATEELWLEAEPHIPWAAEVTIDQLGSVGEVVAAAATVATLAYLAIQIRRSTAVGRATGTAAQASDIVNFQLLLAQDEELARIWFLGLSDPDELNAGERSRFEMAMGAYLEIVLQTYYLQKEGALSPGVWAHHQTTLRWLVSQPGFGAYWEVWGALEGTDLAQLVRKVMAEGSLSQGHDSAVQQALQPTRPS